MNIYARLQDGVVAELLRTDHNIVGRFNPALTWADASQTPNIAEGWLQAGDRFIPPIANEEKDIT